MGQIRLSGNPPIEVILRRSARAKRLSLRMSRLDGRVTLTLPKHVPESEGRAFLAEKESWLRGHLDQHQAPRLIGLGDQIPLHGQPVQIVAGEGRSVRLLDGALAVPGDPAQVPRRVQTWLRTQARDALAGASDHYAAALGRPYTKLTLRDTRSRWGSCNSEGALMYSWRLILAPRSVLNYVAAHEVAHLAEMNHSPAFWSLVTQLYGDWKPQRRWLRDHGAGLHQYRFD